MNRLWRELTGWCGAQELVAFGGLAACCYGLHLVYPPAAWIVGGAAIFWLGIRS